MRWSGCSPFTKFPENPVEKEMEDGNGIFGSPIFAERNRMLQIEIRVPSLIPVSGSQGRFFVQMVNTIPEQNLPVVIFLAIYLNREPTCLPM